MQVSELAEELNISSKVVLEKLKACNIHARPGFPRMSRFPVLEQRYPNPIAERVEKRGISLPSAANLTEEDIDIVCKSLLDSIKQ